MRIDQPSDDPHWDPVAKSLLQVESTKDGLPSDIELLFGDFSRKIRLSETCLNSWCPGERRARLDGVEVGKRGHVWEGRMSTDGVERAEGMVNGRFGAAESTISSDSAWFFT